MTTSLTRAWPAARACVLLAAALEGCSGAGAATPGSFPSDPYTTATSDSGALVLDVRTAPQPPARGTNDVQLTVTRASDGAPVDGLELDVEPWMDSMNHGTSTPTITAQGGGVYLVTEVYLYMPGLWSLRTSIGGAMIDHATPQLSIQ